MFGFLARVLAFVIAVSVIRAVVDYIRRLWQGPHQSVRYGPRAQPSSPAGNAGAAGATILQQDPICGTYVATDTSLKKIVSGRVYHFCSTECREKFSS